MNAKKYTYNVYTGSKMVVVEVWAWTRDGADGLLKEDILNRGWDGLVTRAELAEVEITPV